METGGTTPAGSGRTMLRLDPFALPVEFPAHDAGADGEMRQVEIDRERVVMRRAVRGIPMVVAVPLSEFRGLTLRLVSFADSGPKAVAIVLEHRDPSLSLPLHVAEGNEEDLVMICKAWSRVLRLPILTQAYRRPGKRIVRVGKVLAGETEQRRRRRAAIKQRRPSILMRRKPGKAADKAIHRGEREIIARN